MDQQTPIEDKKSFLRNDPLLVCGMLTVYGVCILALIGATIWGLDRRNKKISVNATSTAFALATEQADATATAIVHSTEQAQYEFVDRFDDTSGWSIGGYQSEYWSGYRTIIDGKYIWNVNEVKKGFMATTDFDQMYISQDFDAYVDTKVVKGDVGDVCSGFLFRTSRQAWNGWGYLFVICNDATFEVSFDDQKDGWQAVSGRQYSSFIYPHYSNRLEISTRGTHSVFLINRQTVFETDDEWQRSGGLALVITVKKNPARITFDNFGFQSH